MNNDLGAGIAEDRWVAVIEQATTPLQRTYSYPVHNYLAVAAGSEYLSPSLVIIGRVAALQSVYQWQPENRRAESRQPQSRQPQNRCQRLANRQPELYFPRWKKEKQPFKRNSMLTTPKIKLVQDLIAGASREELIWLSGYLAGIVARQDPATATSIPSPALVAALTDGAAPPLAASAVRATPFSRCLQLPVLPTPPTM